MTNGIKSFRQINKNCTVTLPLSASFLIVSVKYVAASSSVEWSIPQHEPLLQVSSILAPRTRI